MTDSIYIGAKASLLNPLFIIGFFLFFLNLIADKLINIPVAEIIIMVTILWYLFQSRSMLNIRAIHIAGMLSVLLVIWCCALDYYHDASLSGVIRALPRIFVFYTIIIGYILLPNKDSVFLMVMGFIFGQILYFVVEAYYMYFFQSHQMRNLKYILPIPATYFLTNFFFKEYFSINLRRLSLFFFLTFIVMAIPISSRGNFLAAVVGLSFYIAYRYIKVPSSLLTIGAVVLPLSFFFVVLVFHDPHNIWSFYDWLYSIGSHTSSNVERTFMLHHSVEILSSNPSTGIGLKAFVPEVEPDIMQALPYLKHMAGESPHNYYLEYAVPYGLPALFLVMAIWTLIYNSLIQTMKLNNKSPAIAMCIAGVIGWTMLFEPVAGITRLDIIALLVIGFYGLSNNTLQRRKNLCS